MISTDTASSLWFLSSLNNNNIIPTLSLISISSVKKFAGKCPDTYSNLISTPLDGCQSLSIDAQSYPALTSQSLRATIGLLQDNWPLFHYVIGISGILPYNRNVTLQTLKLFSTYARLYIAAASPASRLHSAGSLAITVISYCCFVSTSDWGAEWGWCGFVLSWHRRKHAVKVAQSNRLSSCHVEICLRKIRLLRCCFTQNC